MISKLLEYTNTPLGANVTYITAWYEVPWASEIILYILADQAGTFVIEGSEDQSTISWSRTTGYTVGAHITERWPRLTRYIRARFANSATAQTLFRFALWAFDLYH
jgi:hypothetical protein